MPNRVSEDSMYAGGFESSDTSGFLADMSLGKGEVWCGCSSLAPWWWMRWKVLDGKLDGCGSVAEIK